MPNGNYTLTAWVQSSGGQNSCKVYAADFGGSEKGYDVNKALNSWTKIIITGIEITKNVCKVGIISDAKANNWCKVDDISLVRTDLVNTSLKMREEKSILSNNNIQMVVNNGYKSHGGVPMEMFTLGGRCIGVLNSEEMDQHTMEIVPGIYIYRCKVKP
jgi:hypothetical protein